MWTPRLSLDNRAGEVERASMRNGLYLNYFLKSSVGCSLLFSQKPFRVKYEYKTHFLDVFRRGRAAARQPVASSGPLSYRPHLRPEPTHPH